MTIDYSSRNCFASKLNTQERQLLIKLIKIVDSILTTNKIDWIPIGGNYLSVLRYNKLVLPWDDDFDMVVRKNQNGKALRLLKQKLPEFGCEIKYSRIWKKTNCRLYKIFYQEGENITPINNGDKEFTFPFIDLFIFNKTRHPNRDKKNNIKFSVKNDSITSLSQEAVDLDILEYPLKTFECEGVTVRIPTRGFRSIRRKRKNKILEICYDNPFCHKIGEKQTCQGIDTIKCSKLKLDI